MSSNVVICDFSGSVADLKRKDKRDARKVLAVLARDPMVSVWDMDSLWKTVFELRDRGLVREVERAYPWHEYRVTEQGKAFIHDESEGDCGKQ